MGNLSQKREKLAEEERKTEHTEVTFDPKKIYWDTDGNLRVGHSTRNRDEELIHILSTDSIDEKDDTKTWVIIPSRWLRQWLLFAHVRQGEEPGKVNTNSLLVKDPASPGGYRPNKNIRPPNSNPDNGEETPGHYRRVTIDAWLQIIDLYGCDGPAIAVRGIPYDDVTRWGIFSNPKKIDIESLAPPVLPVVEEPKKEESAGSKVAGFFGV